MARKDENKARTDMITKAVKFKKRRIPVGITVGDDLRKRMHGILALHKENVDEIKSLSLADLITESFTSLADQGEDSEDETLVIALFNEVIGDKIHSDIKRFQKAGIDWSYMAEMFEDLIKEVYETK